MTQYAQLATVVYQMCAAFDPYMPALNPDTARAWGTVFERYDLQADDLREAVKRIYAERITTERGERYRVAPADVAFMARKIRQERADKEGDDERDRRAELRDAARAHLLVEAEPHPAIEPAKWTPDMVVAAPQFTDCGHCHAKAGMPCRRTDGTNMMDGYHQTRINAASDIAAEKRRALTPPDPRTLFCGECDAHPGDPCTSGGMVMRDVHPERRPA